ncbi:MAG: hypothetical protein M1390_00935, partial [Candidatus Marsarchaeota archaeon]|nr:hypothetical protein [Candidatus Marsarchaeota archaeon]
LDFAYRYPFSQEAKALVEGLKLSRIEPRYLELGAERDIASFPEFLYFSEFIGILLLWAGFFDAGTFKRSFHL